MMELTAALIQSAEENENLQVKNIALTNMIEELRSELSNQAAQSKKDNEELITLQSKIRKFEQHEQQFKVDKSDNLLDTKRLSKWKIY